jgi:sterol desaturase/sphingolipid hydroxylase (fatty acid hydroxylase superfamily)
MTDLEKELYFVVSEWWDEVFSTAVREDRVEHIKALVKQILEVKNGN